MNGISIATKGYAKLSGLSIAGKGYYGGLLDKILTVVKANLTIAGQEIGSAFPNLTTVIHMVMAATRNFAVVGSIRQWAVDRVTRLFSPGTSENDKTVGFRGDASTQVPPSSRERDEGPNDI